MSAPDPLVEAVARAMRTRLTVNVLRQSPLPSHEWIKALSEALAEDALSVIRPLFAQPSPEMVRGAVQGWLDTGLMSGAISAAATVALGSGDEGGV